MTSASTAAAMTIQNRIRPYACAACRPARQQPVAAQAARGTIENRTAKAAINSRKERM